MAEEVFVLYSEISDDFEPSIDTNYEDLKSLSDFTFICNGETYPAHKIVLATKSHFLETKFKENPFYKQIIIKSSSDAMKRLIRFIYENKYEKILEFSHCSELLALAELFQLSTLRVLVAQNIIHFIKDTDFITIEDFGSIVRFFEMYGHNGTQIMAKILLFGAENKFQILKESLIKYSLNKYDSKVIKSIISILKLRQNEIIESITEVFESITESERSPQDFQVFIDLNKCSVKDLIGLYQKRVFFTNEDLLSLAFNKSEEYESNRLSKVLAKLS